MALITRKRNGTTQDRLRTIVAEHLEMLEPGLSVLETSLRLGRTTIDVVAVDAKQTLMLVAVGEVADEKLLISTLDAYIWCVAFPDNVRRLYPGTAIADNRPPRVVIVAEHVPDIFLELVDRLSVVSVECQELSAQVGMEQTRATVEERAPSAPPVGRGPAAAPVVAVAAPPVSRPAAAAPIAVPAVAAAPPAPADRVRVAAGFDSAISRQWESFMTDAESERGPSEPTPEPAPLRIADVAAPRPTHGHASNGHSANGRSSNGHSANGHSTNGHSLNGIAKGQPSRSYVFAEMAREQMAEHAAVDLGSRPSPAAPMAPAPVDPRPAAAPAAPVAVEAPPVAAVVEPAPVPARPVAPEPEEKRPVNHPALEALRFPKNGVSRQWQEFLDQLAAEQ